MLSREDQRWTLLPDVGRSRFLHVTAAETGGEDAVCGPLECAGTLVQRQRIGTENVRDYGPCIPYELRANSEQNSIDRQRQTVDRELVYCGPPSDTVVAGHYICRNHIDAAIDSVFPSVLCSMMRIVATVRPTINAGWIVATARDHEKTPGEPNAVCYLRRMQDKVEWLGSADAPPTSSGLMALEFHTLLTRPGILLHTHPVFAVLLDRPAGDARLLEKSPRSTGFAADIALAAGSGCAALRRSEGIWVFGRSGVEAALLTKLYPSAALDEIRQEL